MITASASSSSSSSLGEGEEVKKYRFALVAKWATHPFFEAAHEGCLVAASELGDTECVYVGPMDSPDGYEQERIVRNLIFNDTIDGIAISVGLPDVMRETIHMAMDSYNIPVVTFDSDDPQSDRIAYIGTDNTFFGEQLAKTLIQLHPNGGSFGVLGSFHDAPNLAERMVGLRHTLTNRNHGDGTWIEVEGSPFAYNATDMDAAFAQMEFFAQQNVTAIVPVQVGPMGDGRRWKEFRRRHANITLVNADDLDFQLTLLAHRYVDGLVGQLPFEMALLSMKALHQLVQGETLESDVIGTNLLVHLKVPLVLPGLVVDDGRIDQLRIMGYTFCAIAVTASLGACGWTFANRKVRVVIASQPFFLYMVAVGILILSSTIIPLSFDDGGHQYDYRENLDLSITANQDETKRVAICMSVPWCALMGFSIVFASLFSKTWRINKIFRSQTFTRVQVTARQALTPSMLVLGLNLVVLICWTILDPLTYTRQAHLGTDGWNRELSTYGSCQSNNVARFIVPLFVINLILLAIANWQAYEARFIESEFAESKYIAACMASLLQAIVMGVPILYMIRDNPEAYYLILVTTIFVVCMVTLSVIFLPKMLYVREFLSMSKESQMFTMKDAIQRSSVTSSARRLSTTGMDRSPARRSPVDLQSSLRSRFFRVKDPNEGQTAASGTIMRQRRALNDSSRQKQVERLPLAASSIAEGAVPAFDITDETTSNDELEEGQQDGLRLYRRREPVILSVVDDDVSNCESDGNLRHHTKSSDVEGGEGAAAKAMAECDPVTIVPDTEEKPEEAC
ncbi:acid type B receptor subunit 2 [Seminavis robusta]|uniref:Acid type B receptor subunit 2 n=1 Tax=Seminavis robusta TaxID=568900 RepID=A0A9N8H2P2_9STRA|nr:acid type B receptor subunit 2 [Seminavis robusta]|eukprot:Sro22_g015220.1 acid type B receptor subunit 2 (794) ;mRNA; r:39497-42186